MKRKSKRHFLPSDKLVLNILNGAPGTSDEVLSFYERYICKIAADPVYAPDGSRTGYFYDEDLALKNYGWRSLRAFLRFVRCF